MHFPAKRTKFKLWYYLNYCSNSNQISHSDKDFQSKYSSWVVPECAQKSKMADCRHLEEMINCYPIVRPILMKFNTVMQSGPLNPTNH